MRLEAVLLGKSMAKVVPLQSAERGDSNGIVQFTFGGWDALF